MTQKDSDNLLKLYFEQPKILFKHLFDSYHQFVKESIPSTLLDSSSCYFYESVENNFIYIHGFECSNIKIKPPTFPNNNEIIFPHDARKNHLNYFASIIADVKQFTKIINSITNEETIKYATETEKEMAVKRGYSIPEVISPVKKEEEKGEESPVKEVKKPAVPLVKGLGKPKEVPKLGK